MTQMNMIIKDEFIHPVIKKSYFNPKQSASSAFHWIEIASQSLAMTTPHHFSLFTPDSYRLHPGQTKNFLSGTKWTEKNATNG